MINILPDHIFLGTSESGVFPCSADQITLELVGSGMMGWDVGLLREATAAVVHYFREDLGRLVISPDEFADALTRVLEGLGVLVEVGGIDLSPESLGTQDGAGVMGASCPIQPNPAVPHSGEASGGILGKMPPDAREDLSRLAEEAGKLGELAFFRGLHDCLTDRVRHGAAHLEFHGLRPAVKQLLGRKHWSSRCGELEARIVESLRSWWLVSSDRKRGWLVIH
jgi:hypothetical protein